MANNCFYEIKVAAKDAAAIKRFINILKYEDNEFFLYRVFSVDADPEKYDKESGLYTAFVTGDVAWSCVAWIEDEEDKEDVLPDGAHYANLSVVCRALNIGVEIFSEEEGCQFQEHYRITHNGDVDFDECEDWTAGYDYLNKDGTLCSQKQIEDGDYYDMERNEEKDEGGIEDWGEFSYPTEIYGEEED